MEGWILLHEENGEPIMVDLNTVRLIKRWKDRTLLVHRDPSVYNIYVSETVDTVYSMVKAKHFWTRG